MFSGAAKDIKLKVYFGHLLITEAVTAIGKIKQFHNRYYVPPGELASGKNMSALYKAMKRQLQVPVLLCCLPLLPCLLLLL